LQKIAREDTIPLPYYSPRLGRWLFIRPQPKDTRRTPKPFKIGRFILATLAAYAFITLLKGGGL